MGQQPVADMDKFTHLWIFNFNCPKMLFLCFFLEQREKFWKRFERRTRRLHTERSSKICSKTAWRLFSNARTNIDSGAIRENETCTYHTHTHTQKHKWGTFNLFTKLEKNMCGTHIMPPIFKESSNVPVPAYATKLSSQKLLNWSLTIECHMAHVCRVHKFTFALDQLVASCWPWCDLI